MPKNAKKRLPKNAIKNEASDLSVRANLKEVKIIGLIAKEIQENSTPLKLNPYVALKYYKSDWQCFSEWESQELKEFSSFLKILQKHNWEQVYNTGSKIPKHGLAYTKYEINDVNSEAIRNKLALVKKEISEDINFFELRVNQNKLRVHGFQSQSVFFLVVLDRNHEAFPM
ncbi:MAG: hypothetical protein COB22_02050 [Cycloclasticus sp.]|nr:MAG: hypothetical protein COB22_02050 [Cycloclasticus sp.]